MARHHPNFADELRRTDAELVAIDVCFSFGNMLIKQIDVAGPPIQVREVSRIIAYEPESNGTTTVTIAYKRDTVVQYLHLVQEVHAVDSMLPTVVREAASMSNLAVEGAGLGKTAAAALLSPATSAAASTTTPATSAAHGTDRGMTASSTKIQRLW